MLAHVQQLLCTLLELSLAALVLTIACARSQFMNSKVLFKTVRVDKARFADLKPVMIHVNYHVSGGRT